MDKVDLAARPRPSLGSGASRRFRRQGLVPGIVYGHGEPAPVLVEVKPFEKAIRTKSGLNAIISLKLEAGGEETVVVRDLQRDPVKRIPQHVDFMRVVLTERIEATVPLEIVGVSPAVKEGGILMLHARDVEIEALPLEVPARIEIDVARLLAIGDAIHASDLVLPPGVALKTNPETTLASIQPPEAEEVAAPAAEAAATGAEPAVIAKGKEEKKEGAAAAPAKGAAAAPAKGAAAPAKGAKPEKKG